MLEAAGGIDTTGALTRVANHLKISTTTLKRWATGESNPPPNKIVAEKRIDLRQAIRDELQLIIEAMSSARDDADYKALGVVFGVLVDKLMLLENRPTERIAHDVNLTEQERVSRIAALLDTARNRGTGHASRHGTDD